MSWLRPEGVIIDGVLECGLEVEIEDGVVQEIRASSHQPEPYVLSPAFVNAHSHLEYRGMLDQIPHPEYYEWIYELSRLKPLEQPEFVREQCQIAAQENRSTGIAWIGEHSDRPGSVEAMQEAGLGGWVFHEVLTSGTTDVRSVVNRVQERLDNFLDEIDPNNSSKPTIRASLNPHAYYTVDREILKELGANGQPSSIHLAETTHESNFTRTGTGPLADRRRSFGIPFDIYGESIVRVLDDLGILRPGMQCVHCCDVEGDDIGLLAVRGVTIAHCPRSNVRLQCPIAPVREFLDAGITVGLGLDSPASGGKIDMFAEMRSALDVSQERGAPVTPEEVWRMATRDGYWSFGDPNGSWDIEVGSSTPLIGIQVAGADSIENLIRQGEPSKVFWV